MASWLNVKKMVRMKKRIRKTGEIVDVIAWYNLLGAERDRNDSVSYIDSKGNKCVKVEGLNLALDFGEVDCPINDDTIEFLGVGLIMAEPINVERLFDDNINWEQVRIKAAISALQGFCSNAVTFNDDDDKLAKWSVSCADALIAELKKGGCNEND